MLISSLDWRGAGAMFTCVTKTPKIYHTAESLMGSVGRKFLHTWLLRKGLFGAKSILFILTVFGELQGLSLLCFDLLFPFHNLSALSRHKANNKLHSPHPSRYCHHHQWDEEKFPIRHLCLSKSKMADVLLIRSSRGFRIFFPSCCRMWGNARHLRTVTGNESILGLVVFCWLVMNCLPMYWT